MAGIEQSVWMDDTRNGWLESQDRQTGGSMPVGTEMPGNGLGIGQNEPAGSGTGMAGNGPGMGQNGPAGGGIGMPGNSPGMGQNGPVESGTGMAGNGPGMGQNGPAGSGTGMPGNGPGMGQNGPTGGGTAMSGNGSGMGQNGRVMPPPMVVPGIPVSGQWDPRSGQNPQGTGAPAYAPVPGYTVMQGGAPAETRETKRMKENYSFLVRGALLYGIFYAFCMYRNGSGVTFPFFVAASLAFFCLSMEKLGIGKKNGNVFYIVTMLLLGISTFCTDDGTIIFFNKLGVFLLLMSFLLKQYFDTSKWKLGKYLGSICLLVGASLGELGRPFSDGAAYNKIREKKTDRRGWYIALGLLIGVPLLMVVLLLLASADAVFGQMTARLLRSISLWGIFNIMFRILLVFFGSYALTAYLCKRNIREEVTDMRRGEPVLAITVTGLLTVLYLFFSVIQIVGLFLGKLQLPEGYTYAMYARQGFFQLLAVSLLNLIIVLCCMSFFRESRVLKIVLTVMSLCTFIMIASSFMRMIMYIRYYYLTYMRVLVLWGLALLAVLFVGVVANIFRASFPLFRYSMAAVAVLYLALSFGHPDYIIARVNVANAPHGEMLLQPEEGGQAARDARKSNSGGFFLAPEPYQDFDYLRTLSADAAPVLVPYLEELGYHMEAFYEEDAVDYAFSIETGESGYSRAHASRFGYYWMSKLQRSLQNFGIRTYNVSRHLALLQFK